LDRDYEISPDACDLVIDIVRQNVPCLAIDLPQTWSPWVKRVLLQADEIVITAIPDLANLRNAKNLIGLMKQGRANDAAPRLVINMVKTPKRQRFRAKSSPLRSTLSPAKPSSLTVKRSLPPPIMG
jgi:pilus assembly protein CpaE